MEWYYVYAGQRVGPISQEEFDRLLQAGTINADTLVWRNGMTDWKAFRDAVPSEQAIGIPIAPPANQIACSECGNSFSTDNMVQFGTQWICANCKPIFLQRLKEGAVLPGVLEYASFPIRFLAKIVDGCIIMAFYIPLSLAFNLPLGGMAPAPQFSMFQLLIQLSFYPIMAVYTIFFLGKYGATPGKMACKIKVIFPDGSSISYGRATGRFFAEILSGLLCYIGYLIALFDNENRTLHDRICNTRAVRR